MNRTACLFLFRAAVVLPIVLSGCAANTTEPDPFFQKWKDKAAHAEPRLPAKATSQATAPAEEGDKQAGTTLKKEDQAGQRKGLSLNESMADLSATLPSQPITVRFVKEDVGNVLRALGRMANQNIIINPSVEGMVNAHIEETPWNEVLMGIINSYGLILSKEGKLLRVMTIEDLKKQVDRKALQLEEKMVSPLITRTIGIEFANPDQLLTSVKPLLTTNKDNTPRGSATVDAHSRSLVIRDTEENIPKVLALVQSLDRSTPQILIGAHIIETTRDTAREIGVQWGGFIEAKTPGRLYVTPSGTSGQFDPVTGIRTYSAGALGGTEAARTGIGGHGFAVDLPASAIAGVSPTSLGLLSFSGSGILEMQLSALQKAGKINILSSPSIATLDNAQAVIESGSDVPYQSVGEAGLVTIKYREATLKLTVRPHVITDQLIKLDIEAKKDEVDLNNNVDGNPFIIKKLAQTQLIVENGSTVVIAGLSKESHADTNTGVPGAKDIPLLGWLFGKEKKSSEFQEMLIFITPNILVHKETPNVDKLSNLAPQEDDNAGIEQEQ